MADTDKEKKLAILIKRKETYFLRIQQCYDLIKTIDKPESKNMFKTRSFRISQTREEFVDILEQIELLKMDLKADYEPNFESQNAVDDLVSAILEKTEELNRVQPSAGTSGTQRPTTPVGPGQAAAPLLPKINLSTFSGCLSQWTSFYNLFCSLVHDNSSLTKVQKFLYLLSCVSDEPLNLIKHLPTTNANYDVALDILVKRYQCSRHLATYHLEKLFNLDSLHTGSYSKLRSFYEALSENYSALQALKIANLGDFVLFHLGFRNLDSQSRKLFEQHFNERQRVKREEKLSTAEPLPTFKDFLTFLEGHCKILETTNFDTFKDFSSRSKPKVKPQTEVKRTYVATSNKPGEPTGTSSPTRTRATTGYTSTRFPNSIKNPSNKPPYNNSSQSLPQQSQLPNCFLCRDSHSVYKCPQMLNFSPLQRFQKIQSLGRCTNCFGNHLRSICKSTNRCFQCGLDHHSLLHKSDGSSSFEEQDVTRKSSGSSIQHVLTSSITSPLPSSSVLLSTAVIHVVDSLGGFVEARVLIDSGAQSSFLSSSFFSRLGLTLRKADISVSGVGNTAVTRPKGIANISIKPRISSGPILTTEVVVMDHLTSKLPSSKLPDSIKDLFPGLTLADPLFTIPSHVDGIIGADLFPYIFNGPSQSGGPGQPTAMSSIFGWIIIGSMSKPQTISVNTATITLEDTLRKFWELEHQPTTPPPDPDVLKCESIFSLKHTRDASGRYFVPLLLRSSSSELGGSFGIAMKSLLSLERRFKVNSKLREDYHAFMREYIDLGHMREIQPRDSPSTYFIPHHAVLNPSSSTTKLRVVFNGSAKTTSGPSLNDVLYTGGKLQTDISAIIIKFRCHLIGFTADICKMFRQIGILAEETTFQHILWRFSPEEPVTDYVLLTVTYGLRSSPYLSHRTLRQLASDEGNLFPRAAEVLTNETFVDDVITGADSVDEAVKLQADVTQLLLKGGFKLRKWSSNHPSLLDHVPPEDVETPFLFNQEDDSTVKVLGIQWSPLTDSFTYKLSSFTPRFSKRAILSDISKLFDPLGWLSPVVFLAKCHIQQLWLSGVSWDEEIPPDLMHTWERFVAQLPLVTNISIPRPLISHIDVDTTLVAFADASEKGYAAVVYLHSYHRVTDSVNISLVIGKSRVAPLKTLTIPRLELCAAVLAARILSFSRSSLLSSRHINRIMAFSDSTTVLGWIRTPPHTLQTFVSNRVVQILEELSPSDWYHVSTSDNPADCASRGLMPDKIIDHPLWFHGPPWMKLPLDQWPLSSGTTEPLTLPELRSRKELTVASTLSAQHSAPCNELVERYSSFIRLQRITAWVLRVSKPSTHLVRAETPTPLTTVELRSALHHLVLVEQFNHFRDDLRRLKKGDEPTSALRSLHPFIDSTGLLRVGGRLRHASMSYDTRHPLLLPRNCKLTSLLIDHYHIKYLHVGPRTLQSLLLRTFWIISARQLIRSRLSKCLTCLKMRPAHLKPLMGDLPLSRVHQGRPFLNVGTDFGGPFVMKESHLRKARTTKVYLCLFICFATKAVHLEVVSSLSTEAFIAAFDRFISRRGMCTDVYSDCGTNYVGANNYFSDLHRLLQTPSAKEKVLNRLGTDNITWHFNPPSAPHFGGLWEAGIKSVKHLVKKVIGDHPLTFEEFATLFCKVEAILNSRPLCALSPDPHEVDALTPGHFLVGGPLTSHEESDLTSVSPNRLHRWELIRQASQSFWNRWHRDYITTLTQRHKWTQVQPNLHVNDLVLLNNGKTPPFCWTLGRIIALHPGTDNIVRVVTVRTAQGEFRRPVVKLALLPGP